MYDTGYLQRKFAVNFVKEQIPKRNQLLIQYTKLECKELPDDIIDYIICDYVVDSIK